MADKKQLGFRAQPHLAERVEAYANEKDISQSEALRRIVEHGIDTIEADPATQSKGFADEVADSLVQWGQLLVGVTLLSMLTGLVGGPGWFFDLGMVTAIASVVIAVIFGVLVWATEATPSSPALQKIVYGVEVDR